MYSEAESLPAKTLCIKNLFSKEPQLWTNFRLTYNGHERIHGEQVDARFTTNAVIHSQNIFRTI